MDYYDLIKKIDVKKTAITIGGILLLIIMILVVRSMIRKAKAEKKDEEYLELVGETVDNTKLSYDEAYYQTLANVLEQHLSDTGLSGGLFGVNQSGVYDVMSQMRSMNDIYKLVQVFGVRSFKDISWSGHLFSSFVKEKPCTLPEAIVLMLGNKERENVNEILAENGLTYRF